MRKRRKRKKWWIPIIILLAAAVGLFFFARKYFRIKEINISGSDKYTYEELYNYIFKDRNDKNMILFKYTDKKAPKPEIPFIAKTVIDIKWPSTINITVYEKSIIGYVYYYGSYMYFDKDGTVVESSYELIDGIPEIKGLTYNHIVLNGKLDVNVPEVFGAIMDLKQYLDKYNIDIDEIDVDDDLELSVKIGDIKVLLGNDSVMLSEKIYELSCMIPKFGDKSGTLDMREYSKDSKYVILMEDK